MGCTKRLQPTSFFKVFYLLFFKSISPFFFQEYFTGVFSKVFYRFFPSKVFYRFFLNMRLSLVIILLTLVSNKLRNTVLSTIKYDKRMVDFQRERSRAMLEASVNVVPSCFRSLPRRSLHRVRGAPCGLDHPAALGLKV